MSSSWREPQSRTVDDSSPELIFELEWKKKPAGRSSGKREEDTRARIGIWDPPDPTLDLLSFKSYLCQNLGLSGDVAVSYVDSDGDELPIDSECEFREALKFARAQTKKLKNVLLMIDKLEKQSTSEKSTPKQSSPNPDCEGLFVIQENSSPTITRNNMAPIRMTGLTKNDKKQEETSKNTSSLPFPSSEAVPPVWFKNYMETLKNEIVNDVSTKVMADVMVVLNKSCPEVCPTCSHATPRPRHYREANNEEKQHRKKKKRAVEEVESSDAFSPPQQPDVQLLRKVKKIEKRERNLQRKLDHKLERLEQMTRIIVQTKNRCHDVAAIAKNLDKSCKIAEGSAEPLPPASEPAQDKQSKEYETTSNVPSSNETRARMSCSITGQAMRQKPLGKEEYESESDSDNISIISGISNVSDLDHDYNFEVIQTPACFILDKPLNNGSEENPMAVKKAGNGISIPADKQSFNVVCEAESDRNNNRDSPSYEVLSGNASSASSIHLDEDHFHMSRNAPGQTAHIDLIDLGHEDAGVNKRDALVVDPEGKIYAKYDENDIDELNELYLDKRPGGSYAFVNETLPGYAKDSAQMSKSESSFERSGADNANGKSPQSSIGSKAEIPATNLSQSISESRAEASPRTTSSESAQSFTSHVSHAAGKNVYNFTEVQTRTSYTAPKYTVVDKNVSKGLEETKYTSGENNLGARGCQAKREERTNLDSRGKYQRGFTSEPSACAFTEQPQKSASPPENGTRDSSPDFSRPSTDSVHILPETLVSGAVTVASSAYSTARRVLDRIRNMQTGEGGNEQAENGVTLGSDADGYFAMLEEMGFTNVDLNARLLNQFNYDMSRVISELVQ